MHFPSFPISSRSLKPKSKAGQPPRSESLSDLRIYLHSNWSIPTLMILLLSRPRLSNRSSNAEQRDKSINQITKLCLAHDAAVSFLVYASSQSNNASSITSLFTASVALGASVYASSLVAVGGSVDGGLGRKSGPRSNARDSLKNFAESTDSSDRRSNCSSDSLKCFKLRIQR